MAGARRRLALSRAGGQSPNLAYFPTVKKLSLLLLYLFVAAQSAVGAQKPATSAAGPVGGGTKTIQAGPPEKLNQAINVGRVKLKDGTTLKDVALVMFNADTVVLHSSDGDKVVPYELFPDDLQPVLTRARPAVKATVMVKGGYIDPAAQPRPADPTAPLAPPKQIYSGRISLPTGDKATAPLANIRVVAMRPADFAAYDRARQVAHGAEIAAAQQRLLAAGAANDRAGAAAAGAAALRAVYDSFSAPPVPALDMDTTAENGSFRLECDEPQIVIVARAAIASGSSTFHFVWAMPATAGGRTLLDETNIISH